MLARQLWRGLIYRHVPRRGPFDKTNYVENHEAWTYDRKPRQAKWDDAAYSWPPHIPAYTQHKGKHLISQLEQEYIKQVQPKFEVPFFRTGDELEIENLYSVSSQKFSTFKGVCIAKRRWKCLHASFNVIGHTGGSTLEVSLKLYSPLLKNIKVVDYGAGNLRARLNYFRDLSTTKFPAVKKGKGWRNRATVVAKSDESKKRLKLLQEGDNPEES